MILVLGAVVASPGKRDEALALARQHVLRSRAEPGCIEHGVSIDADHPDRLVFVERWESPAALQAHFALPASRAFARDIASLAAEPVAMSLFEASEFRLGS